MALAKVTYKPEWREHGSVQVGEKAADESVSFYRVPQGHRDVGRM